MRRPALWSVALTLVLSFVVAKGFEVLHFTLVSHHWCALHAQFEHQQRASTGACAPREEAGPSVSVTEVEEGAHGRDAGCAILTSQHQRVAVLAVTPAPQLVRVEVPAPRFIDIDVRAGAPCLAFAPKRSPPSVSS